jgi:outer membrane murein-binding lipoprotein Lpp
MKYAKKPILLVITLVVAGLLIAGSLNIPATEIKADASSVNIVKMNNELKTLSMKKSDTIIRLKPSFKQTGYPQFEYPGDQLHPAIARSLNTGYLAACRDVDLEDLIWINPEIEEPECFGVGGDYPSIKLWNETGTRFFATFVPDGEDSNGGAIYLFEATDNTDIKTYTLVYWDWSQSGWNNIKDIEIACDNSKEAWEWGFISMVASTTYGGGYSDAPFISYQTNESGLATISWYKGVDGCVHTDNVIDHQTYKAYSVYDWHNLQGKRWELLIRLDYYDDWEKQGALYEYYDYGTNYQNPAVSSYNDNLVVVFETDENKNKDIKCLYGTNPEKLKESYVANTGTDETAPDIQHVEGNTFLCTFVKNGNLYGSLTQDAGKTWSEPWMISDGTGNVVSEYKTSDLSEKGLQVSWEETAEDIDIWVNWAPDNNPPETPTISGETKGKPDTPYNYTFSSTDLDGENLEYYIDWGDKTKEVWIGPYTSGQDVIIDHTWPGEARYTIKAKTRDVNGLESPWGTLRVSTPKNTVRNKLITQLLQKLIELFPILHKNYIQLNQFLINY